ncbi:MAG: fluoride efflux transporter CrcB [Pedobacter sp.]|nr:MAG: fluoride efflux transporter CrcB [Pedobacter sp.]
MNLFKSMLLVGLGGGVGSVLRFLATQAINRYYTQPFPLATFLVNVTGCLFIGILAGIAQRYQISNENFRYFFMTGLCGGYTTFSAFALENFNLFQNDNPIPAILYIAASVVVGILCVWFGFQIAL